MDAVIFAVQVVSMLAALTAVYFAKGAVVEARALRRETASRGYLSLSPKLERAARAPPVDKPARTCWPLRATG
jgi:hypothetical protein